MLELPALQRFANDAELQGVRVVTVVSGDEVPLAQELLDKVPYAFGVIFDKDAKVAADYRVVSVPQTIIVTEGRVRSRFVGAGQYLRLADALRAETGVVDVEEAGESGGETTVLQERDGRYEAKSNGKPTFSLPVNRGRWTRLPDGAYLDMVTDHVVLISTSRGIPYTAGAAAVDHAIANWALLVDSACPPSARITPGNVRSLGPFAAPYFKVFFNWPEADLLAQIPRCGYEARTEVFVAPNEAKRAQRILWRVPGDGVIYETLQRWGGSQPGERRPVGPTLRNHLPTLKALLKKQGRVIADALK